MRIHKVHCPDRKHQVRVVWAYVPFEERDEARPGPLELLCLDAEACTGPLCHLFTAPSERMSERLRRFKERMPQ